MILQGEESQVEARFGPFRDTANFDTRWVRFCVKRTTCSEINLDAPNGTPR